jgi:putative salt-induced outer membrane protein YdiY
MQRRIRRGLLLCVVALFCLAFGEDAMGDQVILVNGDSLSGTIERVVGGKLTLKTDYSGPIDIDVSKIKKISSTSPVEIHLTDGEVLKGQIKHTEDGKVVVERSDQRETTSVEWKDVASINPPPSRWTGSITVGANDQTGNTHRNSASVSLEASRKTEIDRFRLGYQFNYAHENGAVSARNHYGYLEYDYLFTKKFYGYLATELLSDTFRDLKLRLTIGPGIGYQIWDDAIKSLSLEGGLSYAHVSHSEGNDEDFLTARIGGNFSYKMTKFLLFSDKLIVYPRLDYVGRYLLHNEAGLTAPVGSGWALRLANILDRDSNPPPATQKTDIQWILGLQYTF